ncbi:PfkB family carbohydrate kinase [Sphingomonas bacterium]|uniref:PfkB family carbohydrate kinase n=1 Tax=Sphingomonas bacterium TaxID=1895847 RepID=UPI001C2DB1A2
MIAKTLLATGVGTVILKLGSRGCLIAVATGETWIKAPKVEPIDSTAAGDCFNGALAVFLAEGARLPDACRFASTAAALSVTRLGAQSSMPTRDEVTAFRNAE